MARKTPTAKQLNYSEKVSLLYGKGSWTIRGVRRTKLQPIRVSDGPCGLRKIENDSMREESVKAIAYPCPALLACSFDDELVQEVGQMLGNECRSQDVNALLGPGVNIKRNPLCGRNFEYFSEDPYLAGMLAASYAKGLQSVGVAACLKHFACNSQETYRMVNDSIVDERALHEIYLRPFQIAIEEANPWMVMTSYNKINGSFASENKELLLDTLKGEWKYDGLVVSSWGAVNDPVLCHANGLDVEMPCYRSRKSEIMNSTRLDRSFTKRLNDTAERVVRLSRRCHPDTKKVEFDYEAAHKLALKAAEKSCVLVQNDGVLPLKTLKSTAIIGDIANLPMVSGGGSSQVNPMAPVSFLDACRALKPADNVLFARGYSLSGEEDSASLLLDAMDTAAKSKRVILFLGTGPKDESEGFDRTNLLLPHDQIVLFEHIREIVDEVIVVICTGAPVEFPFVDKTRAILIAYYPGEAGGEAIANILMGIANPSGHLAETWPVRNYEVPSFGIYPGSEAYSLYRESIFVGYRYYTSTDEHVRFPFGMGLGYAKFRYSNLKLSGKKYNPNETLEVSLTVSNLSSIPGEALIQIYVEPRDKVVFTAKRTLQAYKKIALDAYAKEDVVLTLNRRSFEHYDTETKSFLVEGGDYVIEVGESSENIILSAHVDVLGDREFKSSIDRLHIYYQPPKDGFWQYDDAFEALLGRIIPIGKDPRSRPYNLNSTLGDIKDTWIGKRVIDEVKGKATDDELLKRTMMQIPVRSLRLIGISDKRTQSIIDMANRDLMMAFLHLFIRKKRRD